MLAFIALFFGTSGLTLALGRPKRLHAHDGRAQAFRHALFWRNASE
jgi:hypothetical protein